MLHDAIVEYVDYKSEKEQGSTIATSTRHSPFRLTKAARRARVRRDPSVHARARLRSHRAARNKQPRIVPPAHERLLITTQ